MNIEDIKVGETYNVRMKVTNKEKDMVEVKNPMVSVYGCDYMIISHKYIHEQPKYDPCRKFRKGDIVTPRKLFGRIYEKGMDYLLGEKCVVICDEKEHFNISVLHNDGYFTIDPAYLELVTPVEELEQYSIEKTIDGATIILTVKKSGCSQGIEFRYCPGWGGNVFFSEEQCRQHAEAERDRLNAEYKKKQK